MSISRGLVVKDIFLGALGPININSCNFLWNSLTSTTVNTRKKLQMSDNIRAHNYSNDSDSFVASMLSGTATSIARTRCQGQPQLTGSQMTRLPPPLRNADELPEPIGT